jgi:hypothetical protein
MQPEINAAIDPTDRSIPPAVITNVAPTATIPIKELRASMFAKLPELRKASFTKTPSKKTKTNAINGPVDFKFKISIRPSKIICFYLVFYCFFRPAA